MRDRPIVDALVGLLGPESVRSDPDEVAAANRDWTGRFSGDALAVARPGSVSEVAAVIDLCRARGTPLVPIGGNTGLVAGTVGPPGSIALSTSRLNDLEVDVDAGQAVVGAGVTLADLQAAARDAGWRYGVDFAARGSATVGGTVATNAGGVHVLALGPTRRQVLGIEAVWGTGATVRRLDGLRKDNTGYDLAGLLCGSEGTLGVVTAVCVRLVAAPARRATALIGFDDVDAVATAGRDLRRAVEGIEAIEFFRSCEVELVAEHGGVAPPLTPVPPWMLLVEMAGQGDVVARLAAAADGLGGVGSSAVATDDRDRHRLWQSREAITEAINRLGPPHKLDVSVPLPAVASFLDRIADLATTLGDGARVWLFGHLGDGNVHVNVTGVDPGDSAVDAAVLGLVVEHGGSVSAEHGIGRAKQAWLQRARSPAEIATFESIKDALDPGRILNPGVLLASPPARSARL